MYLTEPKFQRLPRVQSLINKVKEFEHSTNLDSPRTQKAMDGLGYDKLHFRRKNKFEVRSELEARKDKFDDSDLQTAYAQYLEALINDYQQLHVQRKVVKDWLKEKQREEDELRGFKPNRVYHKPKPPSNIQPETAEEKLQRIEKERARELEIADAVTRQAILLELEKRRGDIQFLAKEEKSQITRSEKLLERRKRASEMNAIVEKKLEAHRQGTREWIKTALAKSRSFQEKLESREQEVQKRKAEVVRELLNRRKEAQEDVARRRSVLGHRVEWLEAHRLKKEMLVEDRRLQTAEEQAKQRQARSQIAEKQLLKTLQQKTRLINEFNDQKQQKFGAWMERAVETCKARDQKVEKLVEDSLKRRKQKEDKHRRMLEQMGEKEKEKLEERMEKEKRKEEQYLAWREAREQEQRQWKESREQQEKFHAHQLEQNRRKLARFGDQVDEKQKRAQEKLKKDRVAQNKVLLHSTQTRQRLEQTNLLRMAELPILKYKSSDVLLEKLKDLVSEEEYMQILEDYKPQHLDHPEQYLKELKQAWSQKKPQKPK